MVGNIYERVETDMETIITFFGKKWSYILEDHMTDGCLSWFRRNDIQVHNV